MTITSDTALYELRMLELNRMPVADRSLKFEGTDVCVESMFNYLDGLGSLQSFLSDFPDVSAAQAADALRAAARSRLNGVVRSRQGYASGTPAFVGAPRVFASSLFEYLAKGYTLNEFLHQYPSVGHEEAVEAIAAAGQLVECAAYETAAG